jgi:hypothetical protein
MRDLPVAVRYPGMKTQGFFWAMEIFDGRARVAAVVRDVKDRRP